LELLGLAEMVRADVLVTYLATDVPMGGVQRA
jgi:hypothetical protein